MLNLPSQYIYNPSLPLTFPCVFFFLPFSVSPIVVQGAVQNYTHSHRFIGIDAQVISAAPLFLLRHH